MTLCFLPRAMQFCLPHGRLRDASFTSSAPGDTCLLCSSASKFYPLASVSQLQNSSIIFKSIFKTLKFFQNFYIEKKFNKLEEFKIQNYSKLSKNSKLSKIKKIKIFKKYLDLGLHGLRKAV